MAATLTQIRTKVRQLTNRLSIAQLTDGLLDDYINTFILYDFPAHLRLFEFHTVLDWYTKPNIDVYDTVDTPITDPLYNFKNRYITTNQPIYIAGYQAYYTQSRDEFYQIYPQLNTLVTIGQGDGNPGQILTYTFAAAPILQNSLVISAINETANASVVLIDDPVDAETGNLIIPDDPSTGVLYGAINYLTGELAVAFPAGVSILSGSDIKGQTYPYVATRPQYLLYYDDKFIIRPVPDIAYKVSMEVYIRPTELLTASSVPELEQHWQYIAYGAARKILQDNGEDEIADRQREEFKIQEMLVQRRTIVQQTTQRVATIYSQMARLPRAGWGPNGSYF